MIKTQFEMTRAWFDWCFENPEKVKPEHTAIYCFAIEHCNRLGWKDKFGFPSQMTMEALGIKKHESYIKYLNNLVEWGFVKMIQKSTNQYSANIICLQSASPKNGKALDKALIKHRGKHSEGSGESKGYIDKQYNKLTNKQENNDSLPENENDLELNEIEKDKQELLKSLSEDICSFFKISQITNSNMWMKIHDFIEIISNQNLIDHLNHQFNFYKLYYEIEENKKFKHSPIGFMGNLPDKSDGGWNNRDWEEAYKNSHARIKNNNSSNDTGKVKSFSDTKSVV